MANVDQIDADSLVCLQRFLSPLQAQLQCAFLQAHGVPALLFDADTVQANLLYAIALGGVRVMVPAGRLRAARELLAGWERGEFSLEEGMEPPPEPPGSL